MSEKSTTSIGHDPDDAPRSTWEMAVRAQHSIGGKIIREANPVGTRRGRPPKKKSERKEQVSLRLSRDVVAWLRATGPGWQTRIEEILRAHMVSHPAE